MRVLRAKAKKIVEGREKPVWNDVGYTLLIGEWQGKTTYTLVDERLEKKYSFFDIRTNKSDDGNVASDVAPPDDAEVPF